MANRRLIYASDEELYRAAQALAASQGRSISEVIMEGLAAYVEQHSVGAAVYADAQARARTALADLGDPIDCDRCERPVASVTRVVFDLTAADLPMTITRFCAACASAVPVL
ncbi:hypothetical protein [Asanoa iriomotensis]|nr:hypothetical protein [Asanoa iriomotensis]